MRGTSFEQIKISFIQGCFVPRLIETGPLVLLKILNVVNVCRFFVIIFTWKKKTRKRLQTDRRTDRRTTDSRQLEKAQVSK